MFSDAGATWKSSSLDTVPDLSVVVALGPDAAIRPSIEVLAAHVALRDLTWELIVAAADPDTNDTNETNDATARSVADLANAFFVDAHEGRDRLDSIRRSFENASGDLVLLTGAEVTPAIVEFDRMLDRMADGADAVIGWPASDEATPARRDLPTFMCCRGSVARSLSHAQAVYGGTSFFDAMQIAHFWGIRIDEVRVETSERPAPTPVSMVPRGRVCAGPTVRTMRVAV